MLDSAHRSKALDLPYLCACRLGLNVTLWWKLTNSIEDVLESRQPTFLKTPHKPALPPIPKMIKSLIFSDSEVGIECTRNKNVSGISNKELSTGTWAYEFRKKYRIRMEQACPPSASTKWHGHRRLFRMTPSCHRWGSACQYIEYILHCSLQQNRYPSDEVDYTMISLKK